VSKLDSNQRERAIILQGNPPAFLRRLVPVELKDIQSSKILVTATIYVMPEYRGNGDTQHFRSRPEANNGEIRLLFCRCGHAFFSGGQIDLIQNDGVRTAAYVEFPRSSDALARERKETLVLAGGRHGLRDGPID
jgi:hypothetical protein